MIPAVRGRLLARDVLDLVLAGRMQLWVAHEPPEAIRAVCLTEVIDYPRKRVCRIVALFGRGFRAWVPMRGEIEAWARRQGCGAMEAVARLGWARVAPDYELTHVFLEKEL